MLKQKVAKYFLMSVVVLVLSGCSTSSDGEDVIVEAGEDRIDFRIEKPDQEFYEGGITYSDLETIDFNFIKEVIGDFEKGDFSVQFSLNQDLNVLSDEAKIVQAKEFLEISGYTVIKDEDEEETTYESADEEETTDESIEENNVSIESKDGSLKKTGQVLSYDENGTEDSSIKDDGYYEAGVNPSYTKSSNIVTDNVTGLLWEDRTETGENTYTLDQALSYCKDLDIDGVSGWNLPTVSELQSIVAYDRVGPALDSKFEHVPSSGRVYWSRQERLDEDTTAFIVDYYNGVVSSKRTTQYYYVRCVKQPESN